MAAAEATGDMSAIQRVKDAFDQGGAVKRFKRIILQKQRQSVGRAFGMRTCMPTRPGNGFLDPSP